MSWFLSCSNLQGGCQPDVLLSILLSLKGATKDAIWSTAPQELHPVCWSTRTTEILSLLRPTNQNLTFYGSDRNPNKSKQPTNMDSVDYTITSRRSGRKHSCSTPFHFSAPPKDPLESFGRHPGPWALGKAPGKKNTAAYNDATTTWYILICGKWLDTMNSQASNISPACRIKSELTTWFHHMCHGQDIASFPQFREQSTPHYTRDSYSSIFGTTFMMVGWPCPFNPLAICWPWACGPSNDIKLVASPKIFDYTPIQSSNKLPILVG